MTFATVFLCRQPAPVGVTVRGVGGGRVEGKWLTATRFIVRLKRTFRGVLHSANTQTRAKQLATAD